MSSPSPPAPPALPSFGLLKSTFTFLPFPVGNVTTKLSRTAGDSVEYVEPPASVGQGIPALLWKRDDMGGPSAYALRAPTGDLAAAVPLAQWRAAVAADFPDGVIRDRTTGGAKRFAEFARRLLTLTDELHQEKWRLGLIGPTNLYVIERVGGAVDLFLPDLGFAWIGTMSTTKPFWLGTEGTDAPLWTEQRTLRQCAAPKHYRERHPSFTGGAPPAPTAWTDLVQQDLRVVARLLRFVLTGDVAAPEPAKSGPVWQALKDAESKKFTDNESDSAAERMRDAILGALKAPPAQIPGTAPKAPPPSRMKWVLVVALLLVAGGAGGAGWWFFGRSEEDTAKTKTDEPSQTHLATVPTPRVQSPKDKLPGDTTVVPPKKDPPTADSEIAAAIAAVEKIGDVAGRAKAALELGTRPRMTPAEKTAVVALQNKTRAELLKEINRTAADIDGGTARVGRSQELYELYKQFPDTP